MTAHADTTAPHRLRPAAIDPRWGLVEIAALSATFLVILWVIGPRVAVDPAALAAYWLGVAVWAVVIVWLSPFLHRDPPELRGWGRSWRQGAPGAAGAAWRPYLWTTLLGAVGLMTAVAIRDPGFVGHTRWWSVLHKLAIYLVYGPFQALVFFGYIQTRMRTAAGAIMAGGAAMRVLVCALTAGLFALAHAPNWPLTGLALVSGLVWSWLFYARPNVLLLGVSHAVLGTITYSILGLYTRIGPFYAHPEGRIIRSAIPGLKALVGDLF